MENSTQQPKVNFHEVLRRFTEYGPKQRFGEQLEDRVRFAKKNAVAILRMAASLHHSHIDGTGYYGIFVFLAYCRVRYGTPEPKN